MEQTQTMKMTRNGIKNSRKNVLTEATPFKKMLNT